MNSGNSNGAGFSNAGSSNGYHATPSNQNTSAGASSLPPLYDQPTSGQNNNSSIGGSSQQQNYMGQPSRSPRNNSHMRSDMPTDAQSTTTNSQQNQQQQQSESTVGKMQSVVMNPNNQKYNKQNQQLAAQQKQQQIDNPDQKPPVRQPAQSSSQMSALERLKAIQAAFKQNWVGINCDYTGKPGTSNMCNQQRKFKVTKKHNEESERCNKLVKIFNTLRNIEQDYPLLLSQGAANMQNRTGSNFNKPHKIEQVASVAQYCHTHAASTVNRPQEIKSIESSQLLHNAPPTSFTGPRSYHIDNCEMLYKLMKGDTKLVRSLLEANQFNYTESHEWNILWSSSSCKSYLYEGLNEFQRINHFPQSYEITRKDRLCYNYVRAQEKFGAHNFDFIPDTYILPNEFNEFHAHYLKLKQTDPKRNSWIVKPANSSRGRGIHIIDDLNDLNVDELSVISRYISNPLLINGHKFDLRVYVVVTCYEPLRIYVYREGLARFASESYSTKATKNNKFMHLTNYSINKKNEKFQQNDDIENDDSGFKWSLSAFCNHLEQVGIDMDLLWSRIFDLAIKTIACGEHYVISAMKKNNMYRQNCFEVFGFDILVDSDLKPWLVEVNLSPSLATDSPLDMVIKTNLLTDTFNMIGLRRFDRRKESLNKLKYRNKNGAFSGGVQSVIGSGQGKAKAYTLNTAFAGSIPLPQTGSNDLFLANNFQLNPQVDYLINRLVDEELTASEYEHGQLTEAMKIACHCKYRDILHETVQEYQNRGEFIRIYPARNSKMYDKFFTSCKNGLNKILYKMLYTSELLPYASAEAKNKNDMTGKGEGGLLKQNSSKLLPKRTDVTPVSGTNGNNGGNKERVQSASGPRTLQRGNKEKEQNQQFHIPNNNLSREEQKEYGQNNRSHATQPISPNNANGSLLNQPQNPLQNNQPNSQNQQQQKVMITGDDILIEYVYRVVNAIQSYQREDLIDPSLTEKMEKFITHYVWHQPDKLNPQSSQDQTIKQRMQNRLNEMVDRRRRLIKYMYKKEDRLQAFEAEFPEQIKRKQDVTHKFTNVQLEDLLNNSTKNVAQEVVTCLIPQKGDGVLCSFDNAEKQRKH